MWLSDTSIRRPVTTITLMAAFVIFGWIAFTGMGIDAFPEVEFPTVTVRTILLGANPEVMDQDVTDVIEEEVKTIGGIKSLTSQSFEGISLVTIQFELSKSIDVAAEEVRAKVNLARQNLPDDIEEPIVEKFTLSSFPIMWISVAGSVEYGRLSYYADKVAKEQLQSVEGVGNVLVGGMREREIRVWLDPEKLEARALTAQDVVLAIRNKHVELPGGRIETARREFSIKVEGEYASVEELESLVVAQSEGRLVTLRDLGRVDDGFQDLRTIARYNGLPTIGLGVRKQSGANTVAVADAVREKLTELQKHAPSGISMEVAYDSSDFVKASMEGVQADILFGILLTALIMFGFLRNFRTTFISVITIPISLVGAFTVMKALDFTVNNMTMLGLSLAVGLVIDDAIVVMENIFRHVEGGEETREAARRGSAEVGFAVLAATSSIAAVFIPVAFMKGIIGRFFYQFGLTVALTILISALVSLTLTPFLSSRMLRRQSSHRWIYEFLERGFRFLERAYRRTLEWAVGHRWSVIGLAALTFVAGMMLTPLVGTEFITPADEGFFLATFEMPTGTSLEDTNLRLREMERTLYSQTEVRSAFTALGLDNGEVNRGIMFVNLTPKRERRATQQQVMARLREDYNRYGDMIVGLEQFNFLSGGGRNTDIQYVIQGPTTRDLARVADAMVREVRGAGGFVDVDTDLRVTKPDVKVRINRELANDLGVDVRSISSEIYALFGSVVAAKYKEGGYRYDIRVRAFPQYRETAADLDRIAVRGGNGHLIKASNLIEWEEGRGPNVINRFDRRRAVTLYANVSGIPAGEGLARVEAAAGRVLPRDGSWDTALTGTTRDFQESFRYMLTALILSILIIYMILAVQFESFVHPFTIMISLPLTMVGVFGALLVFGKTLNVFSFIGIIMLMGIVTKNAILLVDYANQQRVKGMDKVSAMLAAGPVRLRPILMTAASTIIGVVPVALAMSEGGETRAPMAIAVIGGAITSTLLTLLIIPVVYLMLDDAMGAMARVTSRAPGRRRREAAPPAGKAVEGGSEAYTS